MLLIQVQMRCIFSIFASLIYFRGISSTMTCLPCFRNTLFCFRNESHSALFLSRLCLNCKHPLCWIWLIQPYGNYLWITYKVILLLFSSSNLSSLVFFNSQKHSHIFGAIILCVPQPLDGDLFCHALHSHVLLRHKYNYTAPCTNNKIFLNLPLCTSAVCHINSSNLAPSPDLKPLWFECALPAPFTLKNLWKNEHVSLRFPQFLLSSTKKSFLYYLCTRALQPSVCLLV